MIVDSQIHGGLAMGLAPALLEESNYDDNGNISGGSCMDYLLPTAMETPKWETAKTVTPSAHIRWGRGGGGVRDGGGAVGDCECGGGCVGAPEGEARGHSDYAGEGLGLLREKGAAL